MGPHACSQFGLSQTSLLPSLQQRIQQLRFFPLNALNLCFNTFSVHQCLNNLFMLDLLLPAHPDWGQSQPCVE